MEKQRQTTLGERITSRMDTLQKNAADLRRFLKEEKGIEVSQPSVSHWMQDKNGTKYIAEIAEFLGVSAEWLRTGKGSALALHEKTSNIHDTPPRNRIINSSISRARVPLYGPAAAGDASVVRITDEYIMQMIPTPEELEGIPDAFVMVVAGDSMYPRYRDGERVSVHPRRPPNVGQDCVIVLDDDGNALIKEFAGETDDRKEWKFKQHNPPKVLKYKKSLIRAIYSIVGRPS